jgi:hypothetical protein
MPYRLGWTAPRSNAQISGEGPGTASGALILRAPGRLANSSSERNPVRRDFRQGPPRRHRNHIGPGRGVASSVPFPPIRLRRDHYGRLRWGRYTQDGNVHSIFTTDLGMLTFANVQHP